MMTHELLISVDDGEIGTLLNFENTFKIRARQNPDLHSNSSVNPQIILPKYL